MNTHQKNLKTRAAEGPRQGARLTRRRRNFEIETPLMLEGRQLLTSFAVTYSTSVPSQLTDFTSTASLPKFNPALGTLTSVDLTVDASGSQDGTLTNVASGPESFTFEENVAVSISDGSNQLMAPNLTETQTYTDLAANSTAPFGPYAPSSTSTVEYTSGPEFTNFGSGPGNLDLTFSTLTSTLVTGGGGNIRTSLTTTATATATVTYNYTANPVSLSGNVYEDAAGTGVLEPGDPPIGGVALTLLDSTGSVVATTLTGVNGTYDFTDNSSGTPLPPGTYTIDETQPPGYLQGTNTVGTVNGVTNGALTGVDQIGSIVLQSGQDSIDNNFGEILPVSISGTVYDDVLKAGVLLPGDLPIPGTTISLFSPSGLVATTTTNAFGVYDFTTTSSGNPLPPDTYTLVETQPAGYAQGTNTIGTVNGVTDGTQPVQDIFAGIGLNSGQNSVNNNFGEILNVPSPSVVTVDRFGVHDQPTVIYLTFSTPLNPSSAQNVANYQIFGPTDSGSPAAVPIESAQYDAATNSVTLDLGERLQVHHPYKLTVTGLTSASGAELVGSNGQVGSPYVTTLSRSSLAGFTDIYGTFVPINHGKLYPAASSAGYQHTRYVKPTNLGSFAATNTAAFKVATDSKGEIAPIALKGTKPLPPASGSKISLARPAKATPPSGKLPAPLKEAKVRETR